MRGQSELLQARVYHGALSGLPHQKVEVKSGQRG
jgi:hypothetical protein